MDDLRGLNEPQRDAVRLIDRPLLVLAGAGSGKTTVIARKIAWLVTHEGHDPAHIAAVTFTNKAAREMRERAAALLPAGRRRGLTVLTFHALGLRIIRNELASLGLRPGFTLLDPHDTEALIKELCRERWGTVAAAAAVSQRIRAWKDAQTDTHSALQEAPDEGALYAAYTERLRAYNAVDLDDLILLPAQLLTSADACSRWREQLRYLLVDEYQDTNDAQYRLARVLAGTALTVVGDDDQSVYSWRGARPENLARLVADYPELAVIKLEQNYRSTGRILKAANSVIGHNAHLFPKHLWSARGFGDAIRILVADNEIHESERVVTRLLHDKFTRNDTFSDYTILYRSNHQARPFEQVLREHRVPYSLSGGTSFFDRVEVRDALAYLRLIHNPADDAAFLRVCNIPRREIGPATIEHLRAYADRRRQPLLPCCHELALTHHIGSTQAAVLRGFAVILENATSQALTTPPGLLLRGLLKEIGYEGWLVENSEDGRTGRRQIALLEEFLSWIDTLGSADTPDGFAHTIAHILLAAYGDREHEREGQGIRLMTLHAAKGLEFPHVFLVGMEEDILPHHGRAGDSGLEEERRLAYVGMTRAQQTLTLSYARHRRRHGGTVATSPSRFIGELPPEDLLWDGREPPQPAERQAQGESHIRSLRGLLGS